MARNRTIPFGYRMEHGEIVLHAQEAACVQEAFRAYAEGKGFGTVAEELQAKGVRYHSDLPPVAVDEAVTDLRALRLESQIHQALSRPVLEPEKIKAMIFQCATMKYDAIRHPDAPI